MKIHSNIPGPLVHNLRRKHRINFFVETGTAGADTTELAAIMFDQVWSCDLDGGLVELAQKRLTGYPGVQVSVEHSPDFLRRIKPQLAQPVMYWLDAHSPGGEGSPNECPLMEELAAIGSLNEHSIILVDDIELIESPPPAPHNPEHWPTLDEVRGFMLSWGEPFDFGIHQGEGSRVLAITPKEPK